MKRFLGVGVLALGLSLSASGCKSSCVQLAQKICDCQATQTDRDNCNSQISGQADGVTVTAEDEATCDKLIDTCACHELNTPQGKRNCGLAR